MALCLHLQNGAHLSHPLPACCLPQPAHRGATPYPLHPDSEGQVEGPSLATDDLFLPCCHFLGLRQLGSEQLAARYELFLAWMTHGPAGRGLADQQGHYLVIYGGSEAQRGKETCSALHSELEGEAKAPGISLGLLTPSPFLCPHFPIFSLTFRLFQIHVPCSLEKVAETRNLLWLELGENRSKKQV